MKKVKRHASRFRARFHDISVRVFIINNIKTIAIGKK